jgi:hypothetical protein
LLVTPLSSGLLLTPRAISICQRDGE